MHTVTLLLNGLRQKHEQQLAEADAAAKCQPSLPLAPSASSAAGPSNPVSASAASSTAASVTLPDSDPSVSSNGKIHEEAASSAAASGQPALSPAAIRDPQMLSGNSSTMPHSQLSSSPNGSLQPAAAAGAASSAAPSQHALTSAPSEPGLSPSAVPLAASASSQQALSLPSNGTNNSLGYGLQPAASIPDSLCPSLDPGGSTAWAEARKELDDGLRAMGADPKLADCARKDW